jgi:molybdate transport system ATP-binding protein
MDEPLAALDGARKAEILPFIERLRDDFAIPIVYVSHAVEEVARLADRVVKLANGSVAAVGTPAEVLSPAALGAPSERFAALSILSARVKTYLADYDVTLLDHPAGTIMLPGRVEGPEPVRVAIHANQVTLAAGAPGPISTRTALRGTLVAIDRDTGPFALATIALTGGDVLKAYTTRLAIDELGLAANAPVLALVKAVAIDERGVPGLRLSGG